MGILPGSCGTEITWCVVYELLLAAVLGALAVGALTGLIHFLYRVPRFNEQERTLLELAKLREDGVRLRNERLPLALFIGPVRVVVNTIVDWLIRWEAEVDYWYWKVYNKAKGLSLVERKRLETIDYVEPREFSEPVMTRQQLQALAELSTTLKRLDNLLQQRFRPKNSPQFEGI